MESLKARMAWSEVFWAMNEKKVNCMTLYPAKILFERDGANEAFHDKQKLKQYMTTSHHYKTFFKAFCTQKMKANNTMRGQKTPNYRRRKDKESESNIDSAAHKQTLKQQKQLNDRNHHIPMNINPEC
jgi:hypothetical protein